MWRGRSNGHGRIVDGGHITGWQSGGLRIRQIHFAGIALELIVDRVAGIVGFVLRALMVWRQRALFLGAEGLSHGS